MAKSEKENHGLQNLQFGVMLTRPAEKLRNSCTPLHVVHTGGVSVEAHIIL